MPPEIAGLPERALKYIQDNSTFFPNAYIGCKKSDGVINTISFMYKIDFIENKHPIFLFKYVLDNNVECFEEIQTIKNNILFVQLRIDNDEIIKWEETDINKFINQEG